MTSYRKDKDWAAYETKYISLLKERKVLDHLDKDLYANHNACFLCSEFKADHCHRRLAAEYLKSNWGNINIKHL